MGMGRKKIWIIKGQRSGRNTWKCNLLEGRGGHVRKENTVSSAEVEVSLWWLGGCGDPWESSCSSQLGAEDVLFVPHPGHAEAHLEPSLHKALCRASQQFSHRRTMGLDSSAKSLCPFYTSDLSEKHQQK